MIGLLIHLLILLLVLGSVYWIVTLIIAKLSWCTAGFPTSCVGYFLADFADCRVAGYSAACRIARFWLLK